MCASPSDSRIAYNSILTDWGIDGIFRTPDFFSFGYLLVIKSTVPNIFHVVHDRPRTQFALVALRFLFHLKNKNENIAMDIDGHPGIDFNGNP